MRLTAGTFVGVAALLLGAGCDIFAALTGGAGLPCQSNEACPAGALCIEGECQSLARCDVDADCQHGSCVRGVCVPLADSGSQVDSAAVDGGTAADGARFEGGRDAAARSDAGRDAAPSDQPHVDSIHSDSATLERQGADRAIVDAGILDSASAPALFAIHPPIATGGDRIVLEGLFPAGSLSLRFARLTVAVAAGNSTNRLHIMVPANAGSGPVRVDFEGAESNAVPFRYTTFVSRLGYFSPHYEQTMAARAMPRLPNPRNHGVTVATSRHLYVIGGFTANISQQSVQRARIYADGTLGAFVDDPTLYLRERRPGAAAALIGDRFYALGGEDVDTALLSVEVAAVDTNGQLSPFAAAANLPAPLQDAAAVVIGDHLYLIGGRHYDSVVASIDEVIRARIKPDLSLEPFELVGHLVAARDHTAVAVVGHRLYVFGGTNANDTAESAQILDNGDLGTFELLTTNFTPRRAAAIAVFPSELCLIGGEQGSTPIGNVECAAIGADDSLGAFNSRGELAVPRSFAAAALVHNRFYLLGGRTVDGNPAADLVQAPINFGAQFSDFAEVPDSPLPTAVRDPACAVIGDALYVTGGTAFSTELGVDYTLRAIDRFVASADGDLDFDPAFFGTVLDRPRAGHRLAVADGKVLVIDGSDDNGPLSAVAAFAIDDSGIAPNWAALPSLSPARSHFAAAVVGADLYVAGGIVDDFNPTESVVHGTLDATAWSARPPLSQPRGWVGTAVLGSSLYIVGGYDSVYDSLSSSEVAADSGAGLGIFSACPVLLATTRSDAMLASLGNGLFVVGGFSLHLPSGQQELREIERVQQDSDGSLVGFSTLLPLQLPSAVNRGGCLVELGNHLHLLGGWDGGYNTKKHWAATIQ